MATTTPSKDEQARHRIRQDSVFYEKVFPALLIGLAVITAILIIIAAGIVIGFVPFR